MLPKIIVRTNKIITINDGCYLFTQKNSCKGMFKVSGETAIIIRTLPNASYYSITSTKSETAGRMIDDEFQQITEDEFNKFQSETLCNIVKQDNAFKYGGASAFYLIFEGVLITVYFEVTPRQEQGMETEPIDESINAEEIEIGGQLVLHLLSKDKVKAIEKQIEKLLK